MAWSMAHGTDEAARLGLSGTGAVLRRTFAYGRAYRRGAAAAMGLLVLWTLMLLAGPLLVRRGIDQGISRGDAGARPQGGVHASIASQSASVDSPGLPPPWRTWPPS